MIKHRRNIDPKEVLICAAIRAELLWDKMYYVTTPGLLQDDRINDWYSVAGSSEFLRFRRFDDRNSESRTVEAAAEEAGAMCQS